MRKIFQRSVIALTCFVATTGLIYLVLTISFADDPHGKYAGYEFFPHHRNDIIRFENGKVRSETCCGDDDWGTYAKDSTGRWVWRYRDYTKFRDRPPVLFAENDFVVRRSLFGIEIQSVNDLSKRLFMRRRLFNALPF